MKKDFLKAACLNVCLLAVLLLTGTKINAQPFRISGVSDIVRVFEDGYKLPPLYDSIKIFGIRGEVISGQFVVNPKNNLTGVTVSVSAIKNIKNGISFPPGNIELNFVGSIPLTKNASNQLKNTVTRQAPARFPDYLMAEKQININKGIYQSVWLTIDIPANAEAGIYTGAVSVKCTQGEQTLPVQVTVYSLDMPVERHLKITEWYNTAGFSKIHGIKEPYSDEWFSMLKIYADNMAAHRQNVFQVPFNSIEISKNKSGELEFDFTRFDQIAQVFWDTKKMDYLETGELGRFKENWYSTEITVKDISVTDSEGSKKTVPGAELIPQILPAFERHLRAKGWLNKTVFHVKDEPSLHNAVSYMDMSAWMHKYAPDLIRIDAINSPFVLDELEIGVSMIDNLGILYKGFKEKQRQGKELWFYTTGLYQADSYPDKTIDMPLIDSRLMHWLNYKYDISGYLHWGWNQWSADPFIDVSSHIGDGWHVYPAKDGVLNSLRWEQMRNGIQDFEYFWLLENKIQRLRDSLGSRFSWIDPSHRGKEISSGVVMSFAEHTEDPQVLYNTKQQLINEILDFDNSPAVYVQLNPDENSQLKSRSTIEVFGWTEPGTKIVINKQEIPVSKDGLFMETFSLYQKSSTITIEVSNNKGSKRIVRKYRVE